MSIKEDFLLAIKGNDSDAALREIRAMGNALISQGRISSYCFNRVDNPPSIELSWEDCHHATDSISIDLSNKKAKLDFFIKRTVSHIHRVQNAMVRLTTEHREALGLSEDDCRILLHNVMKHDRSKFSEAQWGPYIEVTEYYRLKTLGHIAAYPDFAESAITEHYLKENHHPDRLPGILGKWGKFETLECVCDLWAMSEEKGESSCREYYENTWKKKHAKHFYDDFNWAEVTHIMNKAITLLESNQLDRSCDEAVEII